MPADITLPRVTFVLGGARSGKSRYAEERAMARAGPWLYLATAEALDEEMAARVAAHQARRGAGWRTVEEPLALAEAIARESAPNSVLLVDCLTLWLTNLLADDRDPEAESGRLCAALSQAKGPVILVANEVGHGIVPENALARRFRDEAGRLHQAVAAVADEVVLMVAGLPLHAKTFQAEELAS